MNYKNKFLLILLLVFPYLMHCGPAIPTESEINEMVRAENFEALYSSYSKILIDQSFKSSIPGYEEPTLTEKIELELIFSGTEFSKRILNLEYISNQNAQLYTVAQLERSDTVVSGLHPYIYRAYKIDSFNFERNKIKALIKSDSTFKSLIVDDIIAEINSGGDFDKVLELAQLANLNMPNDLFSKIQNYPNQIARIKSEERRDDELTINLDRELLSIKRKITNLQNETDFDVTTAIVENSYIFEGYMVALNDQTQIGDVYEVRDMQGNIYLLQTIDTKFSSKGFFELRVIDTGTKIPMTVRDGGFTRNIPLLTEVKKRAISDYSEYTNQYEILKEKERELLRKISLQERKRNRSPEEYDQLIQSKRTEYEKTRELLKTWFLNNFES